MSEPEKCRDVAVYQPSLLLYCLAGYLIGVAVGTAAAFLMSMRVGDWRDDSVFQFLVCIGSLGSLVGFEIAAWRRWAVTGAAIKDQWKQFFNSVQIYLLAVVIIGVSLGIAAAGGFLFDAVVGRPAP